MKNEDAVRKLISEEVKKILNEDYARGIPDFTVSQAASSCAEEMKRHLVRYINQKSSNPKQQREMLAKSNVVLEDLEKEIKQKIEEKLFEFLQSV